MIVAETHRTLPPTGALAILLPDPNESCLLAGQPHPGQHPEQVVAGRRNGTVRRALDRESATVHELELEAHVALVEIDAVGVGSAAYEGDRADAVRAASNLEPLPIADARWSAQEIGTTGIAVVGRIPDLDSMLGELLALAVPFARPRRPDSTVRHQDRRRMVVAGHLRRLDRLPPIRLRVRAARLPVDARAVQFAFAHDESIVEVQAAVGRSPGVETAGHEDLPGGQDDGAAVPAFSSGGPAGAFGGVLPTHVSDAAPVGSAFRKLDSSRSHVAADHEARLVVIARQQRKQHGTEVGAVVELGPLTAGRWREFLASAPLDRVVDAAVLAAPGPIVPADEDPVRHGTDEEETLVRKQVNARVVSLVVDRPRVQELAVKQRPGVRARRVPLLVRVVVSPIGVFERRMAGYGEDLAARERNRTRIPAASARDPAEAQIVDALPPTGPRVVSPARLLARKAPVVLVSASFQVLPAVGLGAADNEQPAVTQVDMGAAEHVRPWRTDRLDDPPEADGTLPARVRHVHVEPHDVRPPVHVDRKRGEHAGLLLENRRHESAALQVVAAEADWSPPARVRLVQVEPHDVHPSVYVDRECSENAGALREQRRHGGARLQVLAPEANGALPARPRLVQVEPDDVRLPVHVDRECCEHIRALREDRGHGSAGLQVAAPEAHRALPARIRHAQVEPDDVHSPELGGRECWEKARALREDRGHGSAGLQVAAPEAHRALPAGFGTFRSSQ